MDAPPAPSNGWYSVAETARLLHCSQTVIRRRITSEELPADVHKGAYRVLAPAVDAEAARHTPADDANGVEVLASDPVSLAIRQLGGRTIDDLPLLITPRDLAERLGCSERSIGRAITAGHLPGTTIQGGRPMVPVAALVAALAGGSAA
jgi:hypothetical protein